MKVTLCAITLFYCGIVAGQTQPDPYLEDYYPVSEVIKQNKVRKTIFTHTTLPEFNFTSEFDTLGREIAYSLGAFKTYTSYIEIEDTIISTTYWEDDTTPKHLHVVEKFVYDKNRSIVLYAACRKRAIEGYTQSIFKRFIYNTCHQLVSIYHYKANYYPFVLKIDFPVIDSFYKLIEIEPIESGEAILFNKEVEKNSGGLVMKEYFFTENKRYLYGTYTYEFY